MSVSDVIDVRPPEVIPPSRFSMPLDPTIYETVKEPDFQPHPLQTHGVSNEYEICEPHLLEESHTSMPQFVPVSSTDWKNITSKDKLQVALHHMPHHVTSFFIDNMGVTIHPVNRRSQ